MAQLILTAASSVVSAVGQSGLGQAIASTAASTLANVTANAATSLILARINDVLKGHVWKPSRFRHLRKVHRCYVFSVVHGLLGR